MAQTLQFRRNTTANLASVTGAVGELFVDTTKDTLVIMDGATAGGFPLARESAIPTTITDLGITDGSADQYLKTDGAGGFSFATVASGSSYGDANVGTYLTTYTGNIGNVSTTANVVTTQYFIGNGSQLTGITSGGGGLTNTIIAAFDVLPSEGYTVNVSTYKHVKVSGFFGDGTTGTQPLIKVFKNTTTLVGPEVGTGWGRYWRRPGSSWSATNYAPNTTDDIYFGMNLPATQGYFELEMEGCGSGAMRIRSSAVTNSTSVPDQSWNGYYTTNCDGDLYIRFNNPVGAVSKVTIVGYK